MLARQVYRATQRKEVCHVLLSLVSLESGLTLTEAFSAQHFRVDRQSCHLMETLSQPLTLVIAPLSLTLRSEWYRDNHVHPVENPAMRISSAIIRPMSTPMSGRSLYFRS